MLGALPLNDTIHCIVACVFDLVQLGIVVMPDEW